MLMSKKSTELDGKDWTFVSPHVKYYNPVMDCYILTDGSKVKKISVVTQQDIPSDTGEPTVSMKFVATEIKVKES